MFRCLSPRRANPSFAPATHRLSHPVDLIRYNSCLKPEGCSRTGGKAPSTHSPWPYAASTNSGPTGCTNAISQAAASIIGSQVDEASSVVLGCHNSSSFSSLYSRLAGHRKTPCTQVPRTMNTEGGSAFFRNSVPLGGSKLIQANGSLSQLSFAWQKHNSCHAADSSCKPCAFVLGQKLCPLVHAFSTFFSQKLGWPASASYLFSGTGYFFRTHAGVEPPHETSGRLQNAFIIFFELGCRDA